MGTSPPRCSRVEEHHPRERASHRDEEEGEEESNDLYDAGDPEEKTKRRAFWCSSDELLCPTKRKRENLVRGDPQSILLSKKKKKKTKIIMFFHVRREKNVILEPRHFGARMKDVIMEKIKLEMEGTCSGRYGFIVCITHIENVSEGVITDDGTARAKFEVEYDCVAYRPFKNEVLDAVVTQVNKFGFFAEAGPLQLFVSNSLVPDDVKYVTDKNCYKSDDGQITIVVDCEVRVKIVGMRIDANDIFCIATIKEDYLGLIGYAEGDAASGAV